eukprot:1530046-Alexandrium_andersonii.AAC.1
MKKCRKKWKVKKWKVKKWKLSAACGTLGRRSRKEGPSSNTASRGAECCAIAMAWQVRYRRAVSPCARPVA